MEIIKAEETLIGKFGEELKDLMVKYDIKSITPLGEKMEISVNEHENITIVSANFRTGIS